MLRIYIVCYKKHNTISLKVNGVVSYYSHHCHCLHHRCCFDFLFYIGLPYSSLMTFFLRISCLFCVRIHATIQIPRTSSVSANIFDYRRWSRRRNVNKFDYTIHTHTSIIYAFISPALNFALLL